MPRYVLDYRYADPEARARVRSRHLAYLTALVEQGSLVMAGPWADQSGAMVVFDADDEEQARGFVEADPYTLEGATIDRRLREWTVVLGGQSADDQAAGRSGAG